MLNTPLVYVRYPIKGREFGGKDRRVREKKDLKLAGKNIAMELQVFPPCSSIYTYIYIYISIYMYACIGIVQRSFIFSVAKPRLTSATSSSNTA